MARAHWIVGVSSVVAATWALMVPGCSRPGLRDVCVAACECAADGPCESEAALDLVEVCVTYGEAEESAAKKAGCDAELADRTACYGTDYECPTSSSFCKAENDAYQACLGGS